LRPCQNAVIKYNLTCFTAQGIESINWNDSEMKMISKEDLIGQLKEKGLKITPQRLAIIDALVENRRLHPGANLIYTEARKKAKRVSLSTVYATLKEFSEKGMVKQLEFDRMENRYEGNLSEHINLICKRCGAIIDYNLPPTIEPKDIARRAGFVVTDARMEYYGYCRDCLKRPD
jgi:Fur family transcriptional regulator, peroxide stress response regulator